MSTHKRVTTAASLRLHRALQDGLDKHDTDRYKLPINIGIAVAALGLGCVARMVLPWPVTKFLAGIAVLIVAVWVLKTIHDRFVKDSVADTEAETTS